MTKDEVMSALHSSDTFGEHLKNVTLKQIAAMNIPAIGTLHNVNFNLNEEVYTVNHTFEYAGEVHCNFYIMKLEKLWEENCKE
jgi:hypothetical protein